MTDPLDFTSEDTVLIVDDAPDNLTLMNGVLRSAYKTKVANNGARGLEIATADKPDLILLDIDMPGMDGYEVCRRLKENPETAAIPVIFLTAKTGVDDEQKGFDVGCVDYITKPISAPIVLARVKTQLLLKSTRDFLQDHAAYLAAEVERRTRAALLGQHGRILSVRTVAQKLEQAVEMLRSHEATDPAVMHAFNSVDRELKALSAQLMEAD